MEKQRFRSVPAVTRTIAILDYLSECREGMSVSQIARDLNLPKSSVHGLCNTLAEAGVLDVSDGARFVMGPHPMRWTNAYLKENRLVDGFRALCNEMVQLNDYTLTLSTLDENEVVYIDCRNAMSPLGVSFRIGMRMPAVFSATGKAMLSRFSDSELEQFLTFSWPAQLTDKSVAGAEQLQHELNETRARGYSIDDGQIHEAMICIGAPIYNRRGKSVAGIALSMPKPLATDAVIDARGQDIKYIAGELSERFGMVL